MIPAALATFAAIIAWLALAIYVAGVALCMVMIYSHHRSISLSEIVLSITWPLQVFRWRG